MHVAPGIHAGSGASASSSWRRGTRGTGIEPRLAYRDGSYLAENPTWHERESAWKAEWVAKLLRGQRLNPRSVADVGCGSGEVLRWLADHSTAGVQYYGYDVSPHAIAICSAKERANLRCDLIESVADIDGRFDVVMALDVLEHVEDPFLFLRCLHELGEHTILHIPLDLSVQSLVRGTPLVKARSDLGHIHAFTKESALCVLADSGHEVVSWCYTPGSLGFPGRPRWRDWLRLPRKVGYSIHPDLTVRLLGGCSMLVLTR